MSKWRTCKECKAWDTTMQDGHVKFVGDCRYSKAFSLGPDDTECFAFEPHSSRKVRINEGL